MVVQDNRMMQSRAYGKSSPLPGSRYRIQPRHCWLKIAGNAALGIVFLAGVCLLYENPDKHDQSSFFLMPAFLVYGIGQIWQCCYWGDVLRRIRRGEVAELVYSQEFQVRSPAATFFSRAGIVGIAALVAFFTVWGYRHSTRPGLALDLFLIGLNIAALWGVHHVFTRRSLILKSPQVRFPSVAEYTPDLEANLGRQEYCVNDE